MKILHYLLILIALACASADAQIVQFSGAPSGGGGGTQYLVDQYGAPGLLLSTTKESSTYAGNCMLIRRASDSSTQALGWINTKQCDTTTFTSFCASTTCFLDTWYDQSGNGLNCTQATTARQFRVIKDTDNLISVQWTGTGQGCEVADNAAIRFSSPDLYFIRQNGCFNAGDYQVAIAYTPTGTAENVARWGMVYDYGTQGLYYPRNASSNYLTYGQALWCGDGASFYMMNFRPATLDLRSSGGYQVIAASASTSVTYTGTIKLMVGNNQAYNGGGPAGKMRGVVLYDSTVSGANRNSINNYLSGVNSQNLTALAWTYTSSDGYTFATDPTIGYSVNDGPDAFGNTWQHEDGGYLWSLYKATNLASPSTTTMVRIETRPGDTDTVVNGSERAENLLDDVHNPVWSRGGFISVFYQIYMEPGSCVDVGAGWDYNSQRHTGVGAEPNNYAFINAQVNGFPSIGCDQLQYVTQGGAGTTARGSIFSYTRGQWYAVVEHAFWSGGAGGSDTLEVWIGPNNNGSALTKIVNVSGCSCFHTDATTAHSKRGIYNFNLNTSHAYRIANWQWTQTNSAYSSFIGANSQPAIPAHNFLLRRDLGGPANDNRPAFLDEAA